MYWTRNRVCEGIGLSDGQGLGKASSGAYLLRLSIIFVQSWLDMPQLRYEEHATVFVRGLGPPMAYAWRKKASSCLVRSVRRRHSLRETRAHVNHTLVRQTRRPVLPLLSRPYTIRGGPQKVMTQFSEGS